MYRLYPSSRPFEFEKCNGWGTIKLTQFFAGREQTHYEIIFRVMLNHNGQIVLGWGL
jgi:hypothetical protein